MPSQNGVKPPSRFSSINVFKLKSGSNSGSLDAAPPPPPKDSTYTTSPNLSLSPLPSAFYNRAFFSRSTASLAPSLTPESNSGPATPSTPYPPMPFVGIEFGKRSNGALASVNGRTMSTSPSPSASGGSLRSGRTGGDYLPSPSMDGASTDSSGSYPHTNANAGMYLSNGASSSSYTVGQATTTSVRHKKSVFKLASLAKRNKSKKDLSDTASASGSTSTGMSVSEQEDTLAKPEGDEGISLPWNFQHNIHVDEGYIGLPPSWSAALSQVGFDDDEIAAIHARRRAAASTLGSNTKQTNPHTTYSTERPASPRTITVTPPAIPTPYSTTLLEPVPRSTSLGKGRDVLRIHPPSLYSVATTTGGRALSVTGGTSPAPSPRTPSFSVKSFVSGIKSSLSTDSASTRGVGSSRGGEGEEPEPYVIVDGDGPDEGGDQGMGDETLIEPYPFDTSSVSSHQTHASRRQDMSEGQQTPRTCTFPQIQVQRAHSDTGHVSLSSSASRASSPLVHSTSLPIPTPPNGYTLSNHSISVSPSHSHSGTGLRPEPVSIPPRTPPRRIYHITNASSDSCGEESYSEPPPAYASPKKEEWTPKKEKEGSGVVGSPPLPTRPIPPLPMEGVSGEPSSAISHDTGEENQEISMAENSDSMSDPSMDVIPGTADDILDISSYYSDDHLHGGDAEIDPAQQARLLSPTPPLVIDKRMSKLMTLPPRISLHQEDSLEDWSESLFTAIGDKGKRSSVVMGPRGGDAMSMRKERRSTIRPMSPPSLTSGSVTVSAMESCSLPPQTVTPGLPDISLGANLALGSHARVLIDSVEEGDEQEQAKDEVEETAVSSEGDAEEQAVDADTTTTAEEEVKGKPSPVAPLTPVLPDVSLGPNVSSLGKDLDPPAPTSSSRQPSIDNVPPSPPPKPKPKPTPTPIVLPPATITPPPRMNIITGISGRSPVNSLFGAKPQPLPIPIPLSQIRAQLRPPPPKSPHPPPTLPLPPLKRALSQPNLQPPLPPPQSQLPPVPSPQKALKHYSIAPPVSPSDFRPASSQTLVPARANQGDRDSGLSTITVTPATIATAKSEVVRTAVASVIDSDAVSLASRRNSVVSTADPEFPSVEYDQPDMDGQTLRTQARGDVPDDSMISEVSSVSLLRDGSQSKWPAPPPPPVELETEAPTHRVPRFRTTSLGRVTQLQAMGSAASSPTGSHSPQGSLDTSSSETSDSVPLTTPRGMNGVPSVAVSKTKGRLAAEAKLLCSTTGTFGGVDVESDSEAESEASSQPSVASLLESHPSTSSSTHPLLAQLQPYITPRNPASCFTKLVEIAEGESGSVFAARVVSSSVNGRQANTESSNVAIKQIPLPPVASLPSLSDDSPVVNKLVSVLHEVSLLRNLDHEHLLLLDAVYVGSSSAGDEGAEPAGAVDTSLWIRMELMERSLADVIGLVAEGLALQERMVARFSSDILCGLDYLQRQHIAHRDVRSDNLLVNAGGVVKLADFSNAIRVDRNAPTVNGAVGVIYWQAPEMRAGPYNALKVDTWSLGATVWELAETVPPFSMPASPSTQVPFTIQTARHVGSQWPPLTHPEHYSRAFHEFLRLCGRESAGRPGPGELLNTPFIRNACGRAVILQLLSQCRAIEETMAANETAVDVSS